MSDRRTQTEEAREVARRSNGQFGTYGAGESGASLGADTSSYDYSDPAKVAGDYVESFESITKNWPPTIHITSDRDVHDGIVTATHHPDMGTEAEFNVVHNDLAPEQSKWKWSIEGEVQAEGSLTSEKDIQRAEMYQDAFVGQAADDDALGGMFDSLNQELGRREGYQVSTGWGGDLGEHTEQHELRIDEPDGGAWEVLQLRRDPRVADMDGEEGLELYETEHGNRDYASEHYISRIQPDGTSESLEGQDPYDSIDEVINELRNRTENFGVGS